MKRYINIFLAAITFTSIIWGELAIVLICKTEWYENLVVHFEYNPQPFYPVDICIITVVSAIVLGVGFATWKMLKKNGNDGLAKLAVAGLIIYGTCQVLLCFIGNYAAGV